MKKALSVWLLLVLVISCILGIVYVLLQQNLRMSANDPQVQIAEDTARRLETRSQVMFAQKTIDISESLASFIMIFDMQGNVKSSEAVLHGQTPTLPEGVFVYAKTHAEDRLTWQPEEGVRIAAVVVPYSDGYVLVGRNLAEVEKRENNLFVQVVLGWTATVLVAFFGSVFFIRGKK